MCLEDLKLHVAHIIFLFLEDKRRGNESLVNIIVLYYVLALSLHRSSDFQWYWGIQPKDIIIKLYKMDTISPEETWILWCLYVIKMLEKKDCGKATGVVEDKDSFMGEI